MLTVFGLLGVLGLRFFLFFSGVVAHDHVLFDALVPLLVAFRALALLDVLLCKLLDFLLRFESVSASDFVDAALSSLIDVQ